MPDTDVQAGTSPAIETPEPSFANLTPEAHKKFMETGDLDLETAFGAPSTAKVESESEPGQAKDESGAAPEAATKETKQEPVRQNREERRNQKLANENRELKARLEALERGEKPAEASTTSQETKPAATDVKRPRAKDFPTIEAWEDAVEAHDTKLRREAVREAIRLEREESQKQQTEAERQKSVEKGASTFVKRMDEFGKTLKENTMNADVDEIRSYINEDLPRRTHLADALIESEVGPQLIHYFAEHFEEFEKLAAMSVTASLRELGRLEVSDKIKVPAAKKHTSATRLTPEVGGNGSAQDDQAELEAAAERNDMKAFDAIMSRMERKQWAESRR